MQIPFCQLLAGEGYQVVHLSRHGSFEEGKDVLAITPEGVPCAFQLKGAPGSKITLKAWEGFVPQITRLVELPIKHPSIDPRKPRRAFFVTNGELDEEVRTEINHRNEDWKARGLPELETIVKGQLLTRLKELHTNFWPVQLAFEKNLLEFFLADGADCLHKDKLAKFTASLLPLADDRLNKAECSRSLASTAILTAYTLSSYSEKSNHIALIEGWVIYAASLAALVEKYDLEEAYWKDSLAISKYAIEQAFENLCDELKARTNLLEGQTIVDGPFYRGRVTELVAMVSAFALWKWILDPKWKVEDWFVAFVRSHQKDLLLWGEAAVPQFLSFIWFLRQVVATPEPDKVLSDLIEGVCISNEGEKSTGLPDPYHGFADVMEQKMELADELHKENYRGRSYTLETLVHLFAKRGWRQQLNLLWPRITHLHFAEFYPRSTWQYCLWESDEGDLRLSEAGRPQSWSELKDQANRLELERIPKVFQKYPELLLAFILTYPHRLTKNIAKFLDEHLWQIQ